MPCFRGLAVSIHTPDGPLSEHSIQKQSKFSRITSYIAVPPPKVPADSWSKRPEQSTFAISITLLTPNMQVPYSAPKPTDADPQPRPKLVGGLPGEDGERGLYNSSVSPYVPLTSSPNETIAAYIYFDGRQKEEVATLLRRGEETWVNSRWVSVPDSEGGGLAEREFLFREVGLERWLNGLDLEGKDVAATIEKRRQKLEKRRRRKKELKVKDDDSDIDMEGNKRKSAKGILRYGDNERSPVEQMSDDDLGLSSDSDSDLEPPPPEAAGQIKVSLFRVLASGEIKKGEYSPQFDAHDDDESSEAGNAEENGERNTSNDADVDHTTSFAKPKTLDPKTISTQTVTGIDGPEKPYATFTFLYRGRKQLQKMGILQTSKAEAQPTTPAAKRRSVQTDFSKLGPLKTTGTVGFSKFRDEKDARKSKRKNSKKTGGLDGSDESDSEEEKPEVDPAKWSDDESKTGAEKKNLSPEDAQRGGELAEGLRKIKLKRAHSAEPLTENAPRKTQNSATPVDGNTPPPSARDIGATPPTLPLDTMGPTSVTPAAPSTADQSVGSPLKKQRPSIAGLDDPEALRKRFGLSSSGSGTQESLFGPPLSQPTKDEEDEL